MLAGDGVRTADVEAIVTDGVLKVVLTGGGGERVVIAVTLPRDADVASAKAGRRGDHLTIRLPRVRSPDRSPRRLPVA